MHTFREMLSEKCRSLTARKLAVGILCVAFLSVLTGITFATNAVYLHDGDSVSVLYTMDSEPQAILADQGITLSSEDKMEFSGIDNHTGTITIKRAFDVSVKADGKTHTVKLAEGTVADALEKAAIKVGDDDLINVSLDESLRPGTSVEVNRVTYKTVTKTVAIPFTETKKESAMVKKGLTKVAVAGEEGKSVSKIREKLVDGKVVSSELIEKKTVKSPVTQVTLVGTSPKTPASKVVPPDSFKLDANGKPMSYSKVLNGRAAAYSAYPGAGTASGRRAKPGHVAVDPRIIPYGTKLYIATPDNSYVYGYAIAADTGTALRQGKILVDCYFDSYAESCQFGIKNVNIYILK